jgi:UDP-glucose/iron transport system ATP-binding protein
MGEALFEMDGVTVERAGRRLLAGVSCTIPTGAVTVVAGPSGAGKSTLLRLCNRLEVPTAGVVRYRGRDLAACDPRSHRREVGMVFQRPTALPGAVSDNLRVAAPDVSEEELSAALGVVGLDGFGDRSAGALSGGEAQRMCLARTLLTDPEVVLMDEPSSSLDPASTSMIERLVVGLVARRRSVVWVTHDLPQLRRVADHVVVLSGGRDLQAGPVAEVLGRPLPGVARFLAGAA